MNFISDFAWWALTIPTWLLLVTYVRGRMTTGRDVLLVFVAIVLAVAAFFFVGWVGGLANLFGGFAFAAVFGSSGYRRIQLDHLRNRVYKDAIEGMPADRSFEDVLGSHYAYREELTTTAKQNNDLMTLLRERDLSPNHITEVFDALVTTGAGDAIAQEVVLNPGLLREYFLMKDAETSDEHIAFRFVRRLRH